MKNKGRRIGLWVTGIVAAGLLFLTGMQSGINMTKNGEDVIVTPAKARTHADSVMYWHMLYNPALHPVLLMQSAHH